MRELHPDSEVTPIGNGSVGDHSYPPDDTSYATVLPGAELFCDRRLVCDCPSRKPPRLLRVGAGRRIIMHGMHSVSDRLRFAVWNDGELVRSLFGFILEGLPDPDDADPFDIHLHGSRVAGPTGVNRRTARPHCSRHFSS
ncbi:DUF6928 family protein [Actinoplanes xinjiangensis]|uniref:Uncharacterized protein n=1 Tax=Actinoplanes xinjiangensis TaxID=512350 RepID=A0A316FG24_9ACTN|nr:hypothetical protein [Actinoplanes xinjiangensis]PWK47012.1 hypothetical protein BC793_108126 [Actinoplanes xinjiangensis]GIF40171.1 hypothetical protein Axi01nite_44820 [Actinoplanes xinjiangensis]